MTWPHEMIGDVAALLVGSSILVAGGAGVLAWSRRHTKALAMAAMNDELGDGAVGAAERIRNVESSICGLEGKIDALLLNVRELSEAVGRISVLETKLDNGLNRRVDELGTRMTSVERNVERTLGMVQALHQMHAWDGTTERRHQ